jgi:hypothetical protein
MSHAATNWAIQQRGLPPATKLLLWYLADRHNPDFGCFPSQAQLARDAEMSRGSVNRHLDELEARGLIRRERRVDPRTRRQLPTRYFLAFEPGFALPEAADAEPEPYPDPGFGQGTDEEHEAEPCLKYEHGPGASRVSNPANSVSHSCETLTSKRTGNIGGGGGARARTQAREGDPPVAPRDPHPPAAQDPPPPAAQDPPSAAPDRTLREKLLEAMGCDPVSGLTGPAGRRIGTPADMAHVRRWLDLPGMDEATVLAEVARIMAGKPDGPPSSFRYFDRAMERLSGALSAPPLSPQAPLIRGAPQPPQPDIAAILARL